MLDSNTKENIFSKLFSVDERKLLYAVLLIAGLIRFFYVIEIQGTFFNNNLVDDSKIYNDWAAAMVETGDWSPAEAFFMAPVYPYFLAVVYLVLGHSIFFIQLLQLIISVATILFIYLIARNLFSTRVAVVSAIITALFSNFIFYTGLILSETLQLFVFSVFLYSLSKTIKEDSVKSWLFTGLFLGLSILFRGNIGLIALFIAGYLAIKYLKNKTERSAQLKKLGVFVLANIIVILPITLHNLIVANEPLLLTSNGGINFYIGNNQKSVGVFITPREFDYYEDMAGKQYAEKLSRKKLSESEASSFWFNRGLDFIIKNPGKYAWLEIQKLFLFFGESENPQSSSVNPDYYREHYSNILKLPLFSFLFVSLLGIVGIYLSWAKRKNLKLVYIVIAGYVIANILFFVNGRFRLAFTPVLIIFASFALTNLFELIKNSEYKRLKTPILIVGVFLIGYYFVINVPRFTPYDALLHQGNVEYEKKNFEKSIEYFKKSLFYNDYYMTYLNIGNSYAQLKDFRNCVSAYNLAIKRKPDYYLSYFNLGFAYTQANQFDKAIDSYKLAIQYKPDFAGAYRNMGIVYYVNEQYEDALYYFNRFLELSNDEVINGNVRTDIENIKLKMKQLDEK